MSKKKEDQDPMWATKPGMHTIWPFIGKGC